MYPRPIQGAALLQSQQHKSKSDFFSVWLHCPLILLPSHSCRRFNCDVFQNFSCSSFVHVLSRKKISGFCNHYSGVQFRPMTCFQCGGFTSGLSGETHKACPYPLATQTSFKVIAIKHPFESGTAIAPDLSQIPVSSLLVPGL